MPSPAETAGPRRSRLENVDLLRGVVMAIMALDHVRDCFTIPAYPIDPANITAPLFFTRWAAEFCAPVFAFLAGAGAFLLAASGKPRRPLASFLATRGLWLVVLELTVVRFGWFLNVDYHFSMLQIIWVIGWSLVVLAGVLFLPGWWPGALGVALIALHNLADGVAPERFGRASWLWSLLSSGPTMLEPMRGARVLAIYPLLPWLGMMLAGFGFGRVLVLEPYRRRRLSAKLGLAVTAAFVLLRALDRYGDPTPWSGGKTAVATAISFLNCEKYPPSLLYTLMTLGPAMMALALFDRPPGAVGRRFIILGRVPLFYYVLHLPLIHLAALGYALLRYHRLDFARELLVFEPKNVPADYPVSLPTVYLITVTVVVALFPACAWFARTKRRSTNPWLSYL
jgi:uncharacterized membrane protein